MKPEFKQDLGLESSEDRLVSMSSESLQEQATLYMENGNDIEILEIEPILLERLSHLDEDHPDFAATLQAQIYVSDLINTSIERIQNGTVTPKS